MAETNDSANISMRILWWVLGGLGGLTFLGIQLFLTRVDALDNHQRDSMTALATLQTRMVSMDTLITTTRAEQINRILAAAEIQTKISNLELLIKLTEDHVKSISARMDRMMPYKDQGFSRSDRDPAEIP